MGNLFPAMLRIAVDGWYSRAMNTKRRKNNPLDSLVLGSGMGADRKRGAGIHGDRRTKRNRDRSSQRRNAVSNSMKGQW